MLDQAPPPLDAHALSAVKDKVVKAKHDLYLTTHSLVWL